MNEVPRFRTAEDLVQEREREAELEKELFGKPVEKNSILEEVYVYVFLEDLEQLETDLDFRATEFNGIETTEQWQTISENLSKLRGYKKRRDALDIDIEAIRKLKSETKPIIEALKKQIRAL